MGFTESLQPSASLDNSSWWRRDAGGREFMQVALPLVISTLSWTLHNFVDRMFLMHVSGAAMSAAFTGGIVWFNVLCVPLGICAYANTFVAQYHGDRQPLRIGPVLWQAVWVALAATPLLIIAAPMAPTLFGFTKHKPEVVAYEIEYFQILCIGGPAMWISAALAAFYGGRGLTRVNMWIDASTSGLNILLDYLLIFGHAGLPAMGVAGAAWATNAALWVKVAIYVVLLLRASNRRRYGTYVGMRPNAALLRRLVYFGGPSGAQMLIDVLGFSIFVMLIGNLGPVEFEATSLAFSISHLGFMPVWGIGMAGSILVGQRLGENRPDLAQRSTSTAIRFALGYMGLISIFYLLTPQVFLAGFFVDSKYTPEVGAAVYAMAVNLLRFVAAYNLFDALLMVYANTLKGAGDTRFIMYASAVMAVLLIAASWLAVEVWNLGVYPSWAVITVWVWAFAAIYWLRYRTGKWKEMRVIEQRSDDDDSEPTNAEMFGELAAAGI